MNGRSQSPRAIGFAEPGPAITDTAVYRDPNYHRASDTPGQLDYDRLARVTRGIEAVVRQLAEAQPSN